MTHYHKFLQENLRSKTKNEIICITYQNNLTYLFVNFSISRTKKSFNIQQIFI